MTSLSRMTCHAVHAMAPEAREALARELYTVHSQIFAGLDYAGFRDYVVNRDSWRTWIYTKHNVAGNLVGYTSLHFFRMQLEGRPCTVLRMEAGTLPAWRGRDLTMVHGLIRLMRVWLNEPWRRFCIFAALT
ncbi:MAG: cyclic nucleotide-binding domain-containing protein, partial [Comamonadaceae bacterium]